MAYPQYTSIQTIRYPVASDTPDVPTHLLNAITDVETRLVMRFANASDRDTRVATPTEGMLAALLNEGKLTYYDGTGWQQVWPAQSTATIGTAVPSNSTGNEGDVFYLVS